MEKISLFFYDATHRIDYTRFFNCYKLFVSGIHESRKQKKLSGVGGNILNTLLVAGEGGLDVGEAGLDGGVLGVVEAAEHDADHRVHLDGQLLVAESGGTMNEKKIK